MMIWPNTQNMLSLHEQQELIYSIFVLVRTFFCCFCSISHLILAGREIEIHNQTLWRARGQSKCHCWRGKKHIVGIKKNTKVNEWISQNDKRQRSQAPVNGSILLLSFACTSMHSPTFLSNGNILATWNVLWTKRHNIMCFCICIEGQTTFILASFYWEGEECKLPFLCCMSQLFWKLLILCLELKALMDAPHHWLFWSEINCKN